MSFHVKLSANVNIGVEAVTKLSKSVGGGGGGREKSGHP